MTAETMTKDEKSLLLFLETCAVDQGGRVNTAHMNADDYETAKRWNDEGFVRFGRICRDHCSERTSHWCFLLDKAWPLAAELRKQRAGRMWHKRDWQTTCEKRGAA